MNFLFEKLEIEKKPSYLYWADNIVNEYKTKIFY